MKMLSEENKSAKEMKDKERKRAIYFCVGYSKTWITPIHKTIKEITTEDASTNPGFIGVVNRPVLMSPRRMKKSNQEKQPQRSNLCQATFGVDHTHTSYCYKSNTRILR